MNRGLFILLFFVGIAAALILTKDNPTRELLPTRTQTTPAPVATSGKFQGDRFAANKGSKRNILPSNDEDEDDEIIHKDSSDVITSLEFPTTTPTTNPTVASVPTDLPSGKTVEGPSADYTDPQIAALRELESAQNRLRGGPPLSAIVGSVDNPLDATPVPTATSDTNEFSRVSGQPRGYTMLYLMHPHARETVEKQIANLLRSQVNDLYLGVLVDGTFSQDFEYLSNVVWRLNTQGRTLTLALYFASGPTMRRNDSNPPIRTAFSLLNPTDFRELVESDPIIRDEVSTLARKAHPVFELNKNLSKGNQNFAIPMLEDNLDSRSYQAMRSLIMNELQDSAVPLRNPCVGCWEGNDSESAGDPIEMHRVEEFDQLTSGDGYTLDGVGVSYPGDSTQGKISIATLKDMLDRSLLARHRYFGLWKAGRQGITDMVGRRINPDERVYEVPTEEQSDLEIELLRHGLTAVVDDSIEEES